MWEALENSGVCGIFSLLPTRRALAQECFCRSKKAESSYIATRRNRSGIAGFVRIAPAAQILNSTSLVALPRSAVFHPRVKCREGRGVVVYNEQKPS